MNEERESSVGNKFFKCFVGRCGDRFIMDHGVARSGGQDLLRFYESADLRSWDYLFSNSPDARWYGLPPAPARWDHMYILPKEEGHPLAGYWGHVVAVPKPGDSPGVGMMESPDGRTWTVLPPAPMLWPEGMSTCSHFEYGGCERIGGKYYLMGGYAGIAGFAGYSMFTLVADDPRGPFRPDVEAFRLCGSSSQNVAWLAAWCRGNGELLVSNYASMTPEDRAPWLLPLRKPILDQDGHLRLTWWPGNERLKGEPLHLDETLILLAQCACSPSVQDYLARHGLRSSNGRDPGRHALRNRVGSSTCRRFCLRRGQRSIDGCAVGHWSAGGPRDAHRQAGICRRRRPVQSRRRDRQIFGHGHRTRP